MEIALAVIALAVMVFEAVALFNGQPGDTISEITWRLSSKYPPLIFLAGFIAGHLFWPRG